MSKPPRPRPDERIICPNCGGTGGALPKWAKALQAGQEGLRWAMPSKSRCQTCQGSGTITADDIERALIAAATNNDP